MYLKPKLISPLLLALCLFTNPFVSHADNTDYYKPEELNQPGQAPKFQKIIRENSVAFTGKLNKPVKIGIIYPNKDLSDFWERGYIALGRRLTELKIDFIVEEFSSKQIEHTLQGRHTDQILAEAESYDYVIFGPSELQTQAKNIQRLAANHNFKTFVWGFHTPPKTWQHQPMAWFDFSSSVGALAICEYLTSRLGPDNTVFFNRGIPGITDDQRSGEFKDCVESKAQWEVLYEHFGQYQQYGGQDGAKVMMENFPETRVLHNANTAMTIGAVESLEKSRQINDFFTTGWGGTQKEIELIKQKKINATPMRMADDLAVAMAEAIKLDLQGRGAEIPRIYLGNFEIAHDNLSHEELDELKQRAFRYSKDGVR